MESGGNFGGILPIAETQYGRAEERLLSNKGGPSGWYNDPFRAAPARWWNGHDWTDATSELPNGIRARLPAGERSKRRWAKMNATKAGGPQGSFVIRVCHPDAPPSVVVGNTVRNIPLLLARYRRWRAGDRTLLVQVRSAREDPFGLPIYERPVPASESINDAIIEGKQLIERGALPLLTN